MGTQKILLVDDEEDILDFLELILEEQGYSVIKANSGKEALAAAQMHHPELILLDIMMPDLTGWDVMQTLRQREGTASIPVVVLSAAHSDADLKKGYSMGIKNYLTKPFEIKDLISEVKKVVHSIPRNKY